MSALRQAMVGRVRPTTVTDGAALWRGQVAEVLSNGLVWVFVPRMSGQDPIGPINAVPAGLVVGDGVIVGAIGGDVNDLIVMLRT